LIEFKVDRVPRPTQKVVNDWRVIEKKGFRVTEDGCLLPHPNHYPKANDRLSAPEVAMEFFSNKVRSTDDPARDEEGYPTSEQLSHLCHWNRCCWFKTLTFEPQWKNQKRNFCGRSGSCDCGNEVKCVRMYHSSEWPRTPKFLAYDTPDLAAKLKALFEVREPGLSVTLKVLPKDHYVIQDQQRENRTERRSKEKKEKAKKKKNDYKKSVASSPQLPSKKRPVDDSDKQDSSDDFMPIPKKRKAEDEPRKKEKKSVKD
jgi:hypothetical protein